ARVRRDAAGRVNVAPEQRSNRIGLDRGDHLGRPLGQPVERVVLGDVDRLELKMAPRQALHAFGIVALAPGGAQRRDGIALAPHLRAQLGDALGLERGVEFDLVNVGGCEHERGDHEHMEETQHQERPRMTSARYGTRSAAASPALSSASSSLTNMRSAWNVRVAGWMSRGPRTTRATMSANAPVVRIGPAARAATIARATARAWRSSPKVAMMAARSC